MAVELIKVKTKDGQEEIIPFNFKWYKTKHGHSYEPLKTSRDRLWKYTEWTLFRSSPINSYE